MAETKPSALVIVVSYKSALSVLELLESLDRIDALSTATVTIADNSCCGERLKTIEDKARRLPNVRVIALDANRGYFGAARLAFDQYVNTQQLPDWVVVCNHDVLIEDEDFFGKLASMNPAAVGVIAPSIKTVPGGLEQNPFMRRRPGRLSWAKLRLVSSNYRIALVWDWLWRQKSRIKSWVVALHKGILQHADKRESVYAPHGSFLIFSRRFFECGGFLDGNLFLYGEEISVAEICRELRLPIIYDPLLQVIHAEHRSTGSALSRFTYECQRDSIRYLTSRYLVPSLKPAIPREPYAS
jgi:GT2 family glycosyltransferase